MHAPRVAGRRKGKRVLRYLLGTVCMKLHMTRGVLGVLALIAYTDADFAAQQSERKTVSAATVHLNGLLINWYCANQSSVSLSTMESEFRISARGVQEILGYHELLRKIGCISTQSMPISMDNLAAIAQITSEASSQRLKHSDFKRIFCNTHKGRIMPYDY
jgi:hypothetical protein